MATLAPRKSASMLLMARKLLRTQKLRMVAGAVTIIPLPPGLLPVLLADPVAAAVVAPPRMTITMTMTTIMIPQAALPLLLRPRDAGEDTITTVTMAVIMTTRPLLPPPAAITTGVAVIMEDVAITTAAPITIKPLLFYLNKAN